MLDRWHWVFIGIIIGELHWNFLRRIFFEVQFGSKIMIKIVILELIGGAGTLER